MKVRLPRICPCGKEFLIFPYEQERAKYCSNPCKYKYRVRPIGVIKPIYTKPNPGWFEKGHKPHNTGKQLSQEQIKKMSEAQKGKRISPRTEFTTERVSGSKNCNWKGGITPENMKIRHSKEYSVWRTSVFQRDGYTCVLCGVRGGILNADHIMAFADYPKLRLEVSNGRTLCLSCHRTTPNYGKKRPI